MMMTLNCGSKKFFCTEKVAGGQVGDAFYCNLRRCTYFSSLFVAENVTKEVLSQSFDRRKT
jgi:hypothetical protein